MVFSIALRILSDRSAAEEAAQDVFLELHGKLGDTGLGRPRPLLAAPGDRASLHRSCAPPRSAALKLRWIGTNCPSLPDLSSEPPDQRPAAQPSAPASSSLRFPTVPRTILILRYQEDMSPDEISGMLDMPVATVKSHLQRTLRLLREKSARALS